MPAARLCVAALLVVLSACASDPTRVLSEEPAIFSNQDPAVDFSSYRTYGYMQPLGTDSSDEVRSLVSTLLVNAADAQMQSRGFRPSENPDLLLDFYLQTREKSVAGTTGPARRQRSGRFRQWRGYETMTLEYTEGTLGIDLVDAARSAVIWEGLAQGPLRGDPRELSQERADDVVERIFERFEYPDK